MTVVSCKNVITFAGDGEQRYFDFNFKVFNDSQVVVTLRDFKGIERRLKNGVDYQVVNIEDSGGGRILYPIKGEPLSEGASIVISRNVELSQNIQLVDNDSFSASLLNKAFDCSVMRDQQLQEQIDRCIKFSISTPENERLSPSVFKEDMDGLYNDTKLLKDSVVDMEKSVSKNLTDQKKINSEQTKQITSYFNEKGKIMESIKNQVEEKYEKIKILKDETEVIKEQTESIKASDVQEYIMSTPKLEGVKVAAERGIVEIKIIDYSSEKGIHYELNTFNFGFATQVKDTIYWRLGRLWKAKDVFKIMSVARYKYGKLLSNPAEYKVMVQSLGVTSCPTLTLAPNSKSFPNSFCDDCGVHLPTTSVEMIAREAPVFYSLEYYSETCKSLVLDGSSTKKLIIQDELESENEVVTPTGRFKVNKLDSFVGREQFDLKRNDSIFDVHLTPYLKNPFTNAGSSGRFVFHKEGPLCSETFAKPRRITKVVLCTNGFIDIEGTAGIYFTYDGDNWFRAVNLKNINLFNNQVQQFEIKNPQYVKGIMMKCSPGFYKSAAPGVSYIKFYEQEKYNTYELSEGELPDIPKWVYRTVPFDYYVACVELDKKVVDSDFKKYDGKYYYNPTATGIKVLSDSFKVLNDGNKRKFVIKFDGDDSEQINFLKIYMAKRK